MAWNMALWNLRICFKRGCLKAWGLFSQNLSKFLGQHSRWTLQNWRLMWFGLFLRVCEPFGHERCSWGDWLLQHIEMRVLLRISRLQSVHSFMQKIMHSCGRRKVRTWWMPIKLMRVLILSAMGSHLNSWIKTGRPPSQKRTETYWL